MKKTVIVTGASVGIGKATAMEFAKQGFDVCMVDVNTDGLEAVKSLIEDNGGRAYSYACDISCEDAVRKTVSEIEEKFGKIDVLVNNAGIWRFSSPFVDTESENWKKIFGVNVFGTMYFCHAVLPGMIENKWGRIINVGSVAGVYGNRNMAAYSASKGAVSSFTKALAKEVAEFGITVNNVVPGTVKNEGVVGRNFMSYIERLGELEEYAYLISFLASEKAAYISGQDYQIDGCRKKI